MALCSVYVCVILTAAQVAPFDWYPARQLSWGGGGADAMP